MNLHRLGCILITTVMLASSETRAQNFDLLWTAPMGTGSGVLDVLSGDMDGDGRSDLLHLWNNGGMLGLHVYQSTGTSYANTFTSGNLGQGAAALAWLTGDMDGDGRTDILQPWNSNGRLGLNVFRSTGTGYSTAFTSSNLGAGSGALAWRTGDADGDGRTDLIQLWNNGGRLGLTVFRSTGTGYSVWFSSSNMGQGSGAVAWLTGDMNGDGLTDIFQAWNNNGNLGLIAYRATGTGYTTAFSSGNLGQGAAAIAFLTGDMNGDGLTDIFQVWNNFGFLGLVAYGSTGTGYATAFTAGNLGPVGSGALHTVDFDGDGLTDLFQALTNGSQFDLYFYRSSGTGYAFEDSLSLCCVQGNLGLFRKGRFDGTPLESMLHLAPLNGGSTLSVYGLH